MAANPAPRDDEVRELLDELEKSAEQIRRLASRFRDLEARRRNREEEEEGDDPLLALLRTAPPDDEPLTPEDETALEEADQAERAGRVRSLGEAFRDLDEADT
jgi:hypothetical protein